MKKIFKYFCINLLFLAFLVNVSFANEYPSKVSSSTDTHSQATSHNIVTSKKSSRIAILGAMDYEVEMFKNILKNPQENQEKFFKIIKGTVGNNTVYVAKTGVGKVNSAVYTQYIINKFSPDYIINTGIAGGIGEGLSVCDIVIATSLVQHDFDMTDLGFTVGYMPTEDENNKPTLFYSDETLVNIFENIATQEIGANRVRKGLIASGDVFIGNSKKKKRLKKLFNAQAVEMEGCAIAQTATLNKIPFVVIRAISDLANEDSEEIENKFKHDSAQISAKIIEKFLKDLASEE